MHGEGRTSIAPGVLDDNDLLRVRGQILTSVTHYGLNLMRMCRISMTFPNRLDFIGDYARSACVAGLLAHGNTWASFGKKRRTGRSRLRFIKVMKTDTP